MMLATMLMILPVSPPLSVNQTKILASLDAQLKMNLVYDPSYTSSGKPKPGTGVCTDVVIRAAQSIGIDLQSQITKEAKSFGVASPDRGIDHRRCRFMIYWFKNHAQSRSSEGQFEPGDVVFYRTTGRGLIDHVGIIGRRGELVHHWPGRPVAADPNPRTWSIAGRFRFK